MVDTISELSELSRKLNQKSDKINSIIATINKKLAAQNFGLEVWLEHWPIESGNFEKLSDEMLPREKSVTYLGYCNVEDEWQLATKSGTLVEDVNRDVGEIFTELTEVSYNALLKEARSIRVKALPLVPRLLDHLKVEAESLLKFIDQAEQAAEKL
jgi:hypothetical protein